MSKTVYWLINLTWNLPITLVGFIVTIFLKCLGCNSYKNGYGLITTLGGNWGGFSIGPFAFCGRYEDKSSNCYSPSWFRHTRFHEGGHAYQAMILSVFWIFVVAIPSAIRYWYFRLTPNKKHQDYDYIWFEYTASKWGYKNINKIEGTNYPYTYVRKKK